MPPLVGFLIAGFTLNYLGAEGGEFLNEMADVGVTLLLFSIGLKLRVKELLRAEVWGVTLIHMLSIVVFLAASLFLLKSLQLPLFGNLDWPSILILSFALSFSSERNGARKISNIPGTWTTLAMVDCQMERMRC